MCRNLLVWTFCLWTTLLLAQSDNPVLYFSDITSGPGTGNSDTSQGQAAGQNGAIVTVWGRNLFSGNGNAVYCNGAEASAYYYWGDASAPSDLVSYHGMQMISFQISSQASNGSGQIYAVINGVSSNSLPFTVRAGAIYFVKTTGSDATGNGSWSNSWRTIPKAASSLSAGDIAYIGNGVDQTTETEFNASVNLGSDGTAGNPLALIVYPGAVSRVGNANIERAFHVWNSDQSRYSHYWVIAKFQITTGGVGVSGQTGFRIVGNHVTAPQGDGIDGAIGGVGNDVAILGNEFTDVGDPNCSKLYHTIYVSGARSGSGPRLPTESNREIAWNYIHDNNANRAINVYSEDSYSAFIEGHSIHDNVIVDQHGDGILLGYYVTGQNNIFNNLLVRAGAGPEWWDDPSSHTGIRIDSGHAAAVNTVVNVYNNTLYACGYTDAGFTGENGHLYITSQALARSAITFANNIVYSTGEPYIASDSGAIPNSDARNLWYGDGSAPGWDTGALNEDPVFVNTATNDFRLQTPSGCIDSALDASSVVNRDLLGIPRPQGSAFDRGAFEYAVSEPGFSILCNPSTLSIPLNSSENTTCTVTSLNDFDGTVDLACENLPADTLCSFDPSGLSPPANGTTDSTLTISVGAGAPTGDSDINVSGTSGLMTRSTPFALSIPAPVTVLFFDDFEDSIPAWNPVSGNWSINSGSMIGATQRKANTFAPLPWPDSGESGCDLCTIETSLQIQTAGAYVSLLGWYQDKKNYVEIILRDDKDKLILKQRAGGTVVAKRAFRISIQSLLDYGLRAQYDGAQFSIAVNDSLPFSLPAAANPFGNAGYRVKSTNGALTTASFAEILITR